MPVKKDQMDAAREMYADWLKYPDVAARRAAGVPGSKNEWAKKYSINRATLWRWEQDNDFKRQVYDQNISLLTVDDIRKIVSALKGKAFNGNVPAIKLLGEWAGLSQMFVQEEGDTRIDMSSLTDAQLDKMLDGYDADA